MSFADAWFDGSATLEGVAAHRLDDPGALPQACAAAAAIPLLICTLEEALAAVDWAALVDARMRKRTRAEDQRGLAPLVIGCGPGFVAGGNVDVAVETNWGAALGRVIRAGATQALAGEPKSIAGVGRERLVYAAGEGRWEAVKEIGAAVAAGEMAARLGGQPVAAPIAGTVRGTVRSGVAVAAGTKVLEIDPRPPAQSRFHGLGERPRRIAEGVAEALSETAAAGPRRADVQG